MIYISGVLLVVNFLIGCFIVYKIYTNKSLKDLMCVTILGVICSGIGMSFMINHLSQTPEMIYLKCIKNIPDHKRHCEKYLNNVKQSRSSR